MFTALLKWPNVLTKLLLLEEGAKNLRRRRNLLMKYLTFVHARVLTEILTGIFANAT